MDNIVRLAELQDSGELSPAAEESLALAYRSPCARAALRRRLGALDALRWHSLEFGRYIACVRSRTGNLSGSGR
jgi:hypothetical protein